MKLRLQEDGSYIDLDLLAAGTPNAYPAEHPAVLKWLESNTADPYVGPTDMELWKEKMVMSDGPLPRWAEDLIDLTAGAPTYGLISPQTQKLADDKKTLRATKPE